MLEDLLAELDEIGWTVSWAFQFQPNHWRVSILKQIDEKVYYAHCADAPTFAEALEDAISKIGDAQVELITQVTISAEPKTAPFNLLKAIGLAKQPPIIRRI